MGVTRLLQAIAGAEQGGAEGFFERLALGLQRAGQDQRLLIRSNPKRAAMLRAGGAEVVELPFGGVLDWRTGRAFRRQVADFRPRVVLTWMNRATSFCPRKGGFVHVARLGGYYDLKYYRHCHHLIGNTPDIVEYLIRNGWPPSRAHYLPNFATEAVAAPVDRALFDTPADVPLIVALGRLHENKAFDVLLAALAKVPEAHLWLAGMARCAQSSKSSPSGWKSCRGSGFWAGATTCRRCSRRPTCSYARRATSRWATS